MTNYTQLREGPLARSRTRRSPLHTWPSECSDFWCTITFSSLILASGMNGLVSLARGLCRSQCAPLSWSSLRGRRIRLSLHRRSWRWGRWRPIQPCHFNYWHCSLADPDYHPEVHARRLFRGLEYPGPDHLRHVDGLCFSCIQLVCAEAADFFDLVQVWEAIWFQRKDSLCGCVKFWKLWGRGSISSMETSLRWAVVVSPS